MPRMRRRFGARRPTKPIGPAIATATAQKPVAERTASRRVRPTATPRPRADGSPAAITDRGRRTSARSPAKGRSHEAARPRPAAPDWYSAPPPHSATPAMFLFEERQREGQAGADRQRGGASGEKQPERRAARAARQKHREACCGQPAQEDQGRAAERMERRHRHGEKHADLSADPDADEIGRGQGIVRRRLEHGARQREGAARDERRQDARQAQLEEQEARLLGQGGRGGEGDVADGGREDGERQEERREEHQRLDAAPRPAPAARPAVRGESPHQL